MVSAMLLRVMPFLGHSGQDAARGCLLHSEAEQDRRVKPMDGGPPVGAVADVRRYARPACGGDEQGNEAVVLGAVDRGGEADHTRAYSSVGAVQARALTGDAERREPGCVGFVLLGALPAGAQPQGGRGDDERLARVLQRPPERLERGPVAPHHVVEVGEIAAVGHVQDAVGGPGAALQATR